MHVSYDEDSQTLTVTLDDNDFEAMRQGIVWPPFQEDRLVHRLVLRYKPS